MWERRWRCVLLLTILLGCFAEEPENRAELIIQPKGNSQSRPARESFAITCTGKSDNNEYFSDMEWKDPSGNTLVSSENNQDIEVRKTSESILSLVFVNPRTKDSGRYTCIASYDNSEKLETYVQITFFHDITWNDCSEKQSLIVNKPGKLLCIVSANPSPQVSWVKLEGTKDIELDKTHITVESDGIFMSKVQESDGGKYRIQAMVTETGRFKHRDINLEVLIPPNITEFQEKTQAIEDNGLVLKCVASSANPDPLYSWFDKNDHQIQTEGRFLVDKTLGTLTIQKAKKEDAGLYSCIAQNEAGQDKKQLQLTVLSKPKILQFEKKNTVEGKSTSLECRVSGVPHPEVSLRKEGSHEKLESGGRMIVESFQEKEITSLKMTISQVMREDDGLYFCHAENMAGKVEKAGHLTVEFKPRVSTPKSKFMKTWSEYSVNLTCIADAIPNATIQWSFNGQEIKSDQSETYTIYGKGGYSNLLVKPSSKTNVYGSYKCEGVNIHGKDNIIIQLTESSVPKKLFEVIYKDVTSTTISFEFVGPKDDGGMPITSYLVEYRQETDLPENSKIKEMTKGTTYILESLKPRTTYIFRFAAKNAVGTGMWLDRGSWTMPKESTPDPPTIISPPGNISAFPDKVVIRWTINQDNGKPIELYQLRYFRIIKDSEDKWKQNGQVKIVKLEDNWQRAQYIITGLEPKTYYKVQLRAKNEIGYSDDETRIFQTAEGTMNSHQPLTQEKGTVSNTVIIVVVVVVILLTLITIDVTCSFRYQWGLLHLLRNNVCGKNSDSNRNEKNVSDEEKGSFQANMDEVKTTDEAINSASPVDIEKNLLHKTDDKPVMTKDLEAAEEDTPMIPQNSEYNTVIEEEGKKQTHQGV